MAKLTKSMIEKLPPGKGDVFLWDSTTPGLGVRYLPSENARFASSTEIAKDAAAESRSVVSAS
jgi:hypothetical protein